MLIPQGSGPETGKLMEARREDDLVQKAFSVLTQREPLNETAEPQVQGSGLQSEYSRISSTPDV